jgi:hypothetical protein
LIQLTTAAILTGGVTSQAQYGPGNVCLFYISNYHVESSSYVFNARSSECTNLIVLGSFAIVLTVFMAIMYLYFTTNDKIRPGNLSLTVAILSSVFAVLCLIGAGTASAGIAQTCREFESLTGGDCAAVFSTGFLFDGDVSVTYYRNLATVVAAVNATWILFLSWVIFAGLEWYHWKKDNSKWW